MQDNNNEDINNKRTLKKVRRHFINRHPNEEADSSIINPSSQYIISDQINVISTCFGLVEKDRKLCMGTQFLTPYFNIDPEITVQNDLPEIKAVTLNLQLSPNNSILPWQYTAKRLESYGDLDLAAWANRLRKYHENYPHIMAKYFELINSDDPQTSKSLRKAKNRAALACKEIESRHCYRKLVSFSSKESTELLSSSYSEGLIKALGHNTVESFVSWTKSNGIPTLFESDCTDHLEIARKFYDCITLNSGIVQEGPEYRTVLYDKEGNKREVLAQYVNILEPSSEGFFISGYFILKTKGLKRPKLKKQEEKRNIQSDELELYPYKCVKKEIKEECIMPQMEEYNEKI